MTSSSGLGLPELFDQMGAYLPGRPALRDDPASGAGFDPFGPEMTDDPYPVYRQLIADDDPTYVDSLDLWVLTRYDHVRAASRNHEALSSADGFGYERFAMPMMVTSDPPDHTRLRRRVSRDFTRHAIESWAPRVERIAAELVDEALQRGPSDLVDTIFMPLPSRLIAEVIGVPVEDYAQFSRWSDAMGDALNLSNSADEVNPETLKAVGDLHTYLSALFEECHRHPREGLISQLMAPKEGDTLNDEELFWFIVLLLVAGNESTRNLLGNLTVALFEHPDQLALLWDQPDLVPAAIEEALRFDAPIQRLFRTATVDYQVENKLVPADTRVLLLFGAANRDPRRWADPDRFLIERRPEDHLAFGLGVHSCLGAPLARLEAVSLMSRLVSRTAGMEPAGKPERTNSPMLRGFSRLPATLLPR